MVAHNADFDMSFIIENCKRQGISDDFTYVDTVGMARFLLPALNRFKLDTVAKAVGVSLDHHHRAVDDAACTAEIFVYSSLLCFVLLTKAIVYSFFCYVKSFSVKYFPNVFQNILFLSSAAEFIFLSTSTRTRIISSDFLSNYNSAGFLLL